FLTVGRRFVNKIHEITDDRIDVITRGLMGLTVACARCHDHKYDPISMADYYGLYGVMRSSVEPRTLPVIGEPEPTPAYLKYKKEYDKRAGALENYYRSRHRAIQHEIRARVGDYLVYIAKTHPGHKSGAVARSGNRGAFRRFMIQRWQRNLGARGIEKDPVFGLWAKLSSQPRENFGAAASRLLADPPPANPVILTALRNKKPNSLAEVAEVFGVVLEKAHSDWTAARKKNPNIQKLPDAAAEQLRVALHRRTNIDLKRARKMINQGERNKIRSLQRRINDWMVSSPAAPVRAMVVRDAPKPYEPRLFHRGNAKQPTRRVPRRFLRILEHVDGGRPFTDGSGRLELARAIVHPKNPLTARVIVNRIWAWHFGEGLVATPSDFGIRGRTPSHPLLLDYLASRFMNDGWSVKRMHRRIMASATYRQRSLDRPDHRAKDPTNTLLWRFNRRKLDFEQMRDALLQVAGRLDLTLGGRPVDLFQAPYPTRRSVYGHVDRQLLPEAFRTFDFASPDASVPKRPNTTVPQQALYLMNSP
ncbi:MAG: DUF1553 domain-containing protein, partial [Phycisphaeraceae bacterium]|nr:DUF1553 domain-containing protein [Phycisphaeraceae bacterium]